MAVGVSRQVGHRRLTELKLKGETPTVFCRSAGVNQIFIVDELSGQS